MQFKVAKKYHKEEHMKRFIVFAVVAFLALPVVSFAGSATADGMSPSAATSRLTSVIQPSHRVQTIEQHHEDLIVVMTTRLMSMATFSRQQARHGSTSSSRVPMDGAPRHSASLKASSGAQQAAPTMAPLL